MVKKITDAYAFRVEMKCDGRGPFNSTCWQQHGINRYIGIFGNFHNNEKFPNLFEDYKDNHFVNFNRESVNDYRVGVPHAGGLFQWFGQFMPIITLECHVYRLHLKQMYIGRSGNQAIWKPDDVIKQKLICKYENSKFTWEELDNIYHFSNDKDPFSFLFSS